MHAQEWIVLGAVALAALFFLRGFRRNLTHKGERAGCCCGDGAGRCRKKTGRIESNPQG
jgi:hypothetical protein